MNFKLDENLPAGLVGIFGPAGHDASSVFEQNLSGEKDDILLDVCRRENRVSVTLDLDFADIHKYPPSENQGIIVLRLRRQGKPHVEEVVTRLLLAFDSEPVEKRLWIVDENKIRIRS